MRPNKALRSRWNAIRYRHLLNQVERYCMFIGYPRSGHSLTGSLLTAHPDAVISHELDVLRFIESGFSERQIYALVIEKDRKFTDQGRRWAGFQYRVPGQWQGRVRHLRVIGDKKGGESSTRLSTKPWLLDDLRKTLSVPLRFIHQVRNPFDNITTMHKKAREPLRATMNNYFRLCESVTNTRKKLSKEEIIDIHHETLIANPRESLVLLCDFLGLEADQAYLDPCLDKIDQRVHTSRFSIEWTPVLIKEVESRMGEYEFLSGYRFFDVD